MTIQELLKSLGLDDATITKITDGMKTNKIYTSGEENLDIRYGKLKTDHDNSTKQLTEAQKLIEELKKSTGEDMKAKVTEYETKVKELNAELAKQKLQSAIKVGLLSEKATDIDYLSFKLGEAEKLELDDKEQIKGWNDKVKDLKTKFPNMFETTSKKTIEPNKLNNGNNNDTVTKEQFATMTYEQRLALKQQDEQAYKTLAGKTN